MKKGNHGKGTEGDKLPGKTPPIKNQLLSKKAEKYLKEGGKIEDYPEKDSKYKRNNRLP